MERSLARSRGAVLDPGSDGIAWRGRTDARLCGVRGHPSRAAGGLRLAQLAGDEARVSSAPSDSGEPAINRLDATDDEKATLRFADWGEFEDEIEADADKTARERLAVLRAEDAENDFHSRQAEQIRQSTERVEARAVRS